MTNRREAGPVKYATARREAVAGGLVLAVAYVGLALAYIWPPEWRDTETLYVAASWVAFMIRTFAFHGGLAMIGLAVAAAVRRQRAVTLAAVPLLAWTLGPAVQSYLPREIPPVDGGTITVMSVNLLSPNRQTEGIVGEVVAEQPDVLLLQEYAPHWHRAFQEALGAEYPYVATAVRTDNFGMAVYSRLPYFEEVDFGVRLGNVEVPQARTVLRVGGRDVAFYNVHLVPPRRWEWIAEQGRALDALLERVKRESRPVVICGDFNFTNDSAYAAALHRLGFIDAHERSGTGRGATWPANGWLRWAPGVRLDHIYLSPELTSTRSTTGTGEGSDHRPIVAEIGFRIPASGTPP